MRYMYICWCNENNHDKVWGIIWCNEHQNEKRLDNKYVTFWGRRGAKLQTKQWTGSSFEAYYLYNSKIKKGYKTIDIHKLKDVYEGFQQDLEKTAVWALLSV